MGAFSELWDVDASAAPYSLHSAFEGAPDWAPFGRRCCTVLLKALLIGRLLAGALAAPVVSLTVKTSLGPTALLKAAPSFLKALQRLLIGAP